MLAKSPAYLGNRANAMTKLNVFSEVRGLAEFGR